MQLYNSLTRKKELFTPQQKGKVGLYACGITAYDYCHIGHARSAIVFDVLVRYLRYRGYEVTFVRNFTDIDDKIIARAHREGLAWDSISETYIAAFHEDMDRLAVCRADIEPKATEHIGEMIALCTALIEKKHAYATLSGDVYFRVRSFPEYGKLSGRSIDDLQSGARVAVGEEKEDPLDFALWKSAKPDEPFWESPWGKGRPGWHIECSAMSEKYLPLPFDIHGGGQDLIFPHHENEIAQTEAYAGKKLANYWVHNGFVQINAEKMAKSLGNFKTIREILKNTEPEVLRYFLLARQYRSPVDYSPAALEEAEKNLKRLYENILALDSILATPDPVPGKATAEATQYASELHTLFEQWDQAMEDDLNTAAALGHINNIFHLLNRMSEHKGLKKNAAGKELFKAIREKLHVWSSVFGIFTQEPASFLASLKAVRSLRKGIDVVKVESLMQERTRAKEQKDFATADAVRETLIEMGIDVRDTPEGPLWDIV